MPPIDNAASTTGVAWGPVSHAAAVTPADGTEFANVTTALWVGGGGNLSVVMAGGETVTLSGVLPGTLVPLRVTRVRSTGTTATNILALW